ncbi:MAG: flavodoxin family protein [Syntrophomonadaceae bacterium]
MRIAALNGSPKKNGTVAKLMREVIAGINEQFDIEWVDVCSLDMRNCLGCMKCRTVGNCALPEDDAHAIGRIISKADGLIIGTPTHWGNMSSSLKLLLDRNVPVFMGARANGMPEPRQKGKPAVIVTACTTPWPLNRIARESRGAVDAVKHVLKYGGYKIVGTIVKPGTKKNSGISKGILKRARASGRKLSNLTMK